MAVQGEAGEHLAQGRQARAHEQCLDALLRRGRCDRRRALQEEAGVVADFRRQRAVGLRAAAADGDLRPHRAAGHDGNLGARELAAQAVLDVLHDRRNLARQIAKLVDTVDEDADALLVEPAQDAQQRHVGGRERLPRGENDDVDIGVLQGATGDLVAHQKRVVGAGRVDDAGGKAEVAAGEIEIGRLDHVGVDALVLRPRAGEAGADVPFEHLGRDRGECVLLAEQRAQRGAEALLGAAPHRIDVLLEQLWLEARNQALGQLADMPAATRQPLPLVRVEERELGRDIGWSIGAGEVQMRNRRSPRVDVGGQEAGTADQPVDERALAGLDLTDHGDAARELRQEAQHVVHKGAAAERPRRLQLASADHQLAPHGFKLRADLACREQPHPGVCTGFRPRMLGVNVMRWIRHGLPLQEIPAAAIRDLGCDPGSGWYLTQLQCILLASSAPAIVHHSRGACSDNRHGGARGCGERGARPPGGRRPVALWLRDCHGGSLYDVDNGSAKRGEMIGGSRAEVRMCRHAWNEIRLVCARDRGCHLPDHILSEHMRRAAALG